MLYVVILSILPTRQLRKKTGKVSLTIVIIDLTLFHVISEHLAVSDTLIMVVSTIGP